MNYGEIKAAVNLYSHRTDLDVIYPTISLLATSRLSIDTSMPEQQLNISFDTTINPFDVPVGFIKPMLLTVNGRPQIYISEKQLQAFSNNAREGVSSYYTIKGRKIELVRYSDGMAVSLDYINSLAPLLSDTDRNPVSDLFPQAYIYAFLIEVFAYAQDPEALLKAEQVYGQEVDRIQKYTNSASYGDDLAVRSI